MSNTTFASFHHQHYCAYIESIFHLHHGKAVSILLPLSFSFDHPLLHIRKERSRAEQRRCAHDTRWCRGQSTATARASAPATGTTRRRPATGGNHTTIATRHIRHRTHQRGNTARWRRHAGRERHRRGRGDAAVGCVDRRTGCPRHGAVRGAVRVEHGVDDVDDTTREKHIRDDDSGGVDEDVAVVGDGDVKVAAGEGHLRGVGEGAGVRDCAVQDVILQDALQLLGGEVRGADALEGGIGGGKYGQASRRRVQGLGRSGGVGGAEEGGEVGSLCDGGEVGRDREKSVDDMDDAAVEDEVLCTRKSERE